MRLASGATRYILYYKERERGEDYQKSEIERAEKPYIRKCFSLCVRGILAESDKTGEGRNKSSHSADVYTEQKLFIIRGKFREQYCTWNVTDNLARADCG